MIATSEGREIPGFVLVEGGKFRMGSPNGGEGDESPARRVTVNGFWLGRYPATRKEWRAVMGAIPDSIPRRFRGERFSRAGRELGNR